MGPTNKQKLQRSNWPNRAKIPKALKTPLVSYSFHDILTADMLYRKKRKTNMQIKGATIKKIILSYTGKELVSSPTELCIPMTALTFLSGQSCTIVWAAKSISSWKLRKKGVIGCRVTLRRESAFVFLSKLYIYGKEGLMEKNNNFLNFVLPFHFGVSKNENFIELRASDRFSDNFSGFSVSFN